MSVYVDTLWATEPRRGWPYKWSCHLTADSIEELHQFAEAIGMKRAWFQDHPTFPHYDLTKTRRIAAVRHGAIEESRVDSVRRQRDKYITRMECDPGPAASETTFPAS